MDTVGQIRKNIVGVSATKELSAEKIPAEERGRHVKLLQIPQFFFHRNKAIFKYIFHIKKRFFLSQHKRLI